MVKICHNVLLGVPMDVAQATRDLVQKAIDAERTDCDFAILLEEQGMASGMELQSEDKDVSDGLK